MFNHSAVRSPFGLPLGPSNYAFRHGSMFRYVCQSTETSFFVCSYAHIIATFRFLFNGKRLKPSDTPQDVSKRQGMW